MKKWTLLLLMISGVVFYACKHTPPDNPGTGTGGTGTGSNGTGGTTGVCFSSEILPLFQSYCAKSGCHNSTTKAGGYILDSYDNLFLKENKPSRDNIIPFNASKSKLVEVLLATGSDKMPPTGNTDLTVAQKNRIAEWINEGAKNTTNCGSSCDTTQFKYAANIKPLLNTYCTGCHSGINAAGAIDLTSYQIAHDLGVSGQLYGVVAHLPGYDSMPKGSGQLSACEKITINKWGKSGAPNN